MSLHAWLTLAILVCVLCLLPVRGCACIHDHLCAHTCVPASPHVGLFTQRFIYKLCHPAIARHTSQCISAPLLFTAFPHAETVKRVIYTQVNRYCELVIQSMHYNPPHADSKAPVSPRLLLRGSEEHVCLASQQKLSVGLLV